MPIITQNNSNPDVLNAIKPHRRTYIPEERIEILQKYKNSSRVAGYVRVSTRDRQDPYIQVNGLKELFEKERWWGTIFIERHTGKEPTLDKRKVLKRLIEEIKLKQWDGLAFIRPDRLSRHNETGGYAIRTTIESGGFVYIRDFQKKYNKETPQEEIDQLHFFFTVGAIESSIRSSRMKDTLKHNKSDNWGKIKTYGGIRISKLSREAIIKLRKQGNSITDIAKLFNSSRTRIYNHLNDKHEKHT